MKCLICGIEISENETFCENCNKPKSTTSSTKYNRVDDNAVSGYPLINFSRKYFMILYELSLWLFLFGSAIGFAVLFDNAMGEGWGILGFIIGIMVGLVFIVVSSGLVAVFLRIGADIEKIKNSNSK